MKHLIFSAVLQVYVIETSIELVARQLLLLYLALIPMEIMGINGRWEIEELLIS